MEAQGHRLLGEILVDLGFTNLTQVNEARRRQMVRPTVLLGEYLVELGFVTPAQLLEALSRQAEDLCRTALPPTIENLCRGLPARALELCQLVSLPMFQVVADQLEEGIYIEAWGERRSDDRILFVNRAFASLAGMRPEDFMGKQEIPVVNFGARFFDDPEGFLKQVHEAAHKRPDPATLVFEVSKPRKMRIEVRTFPIKNKAGELVGAGGFLRQT